MDFVKLNDTVNFVSTTYNISGVSKHADITPKFWVLENNNHTPIVTNVDMVPVTHGTIGFSGVYRGEFVVDGANGFQIGDRCQVLVSGQVDGRSAFDHPWQFLVVSGDFDDMPTPTGISYAVWEEKTALHPRWDTFGSGVHVASGDWAYYANIKFTKDTSNDEYTVDWYRNSVPVPSSEISTPQLQVIKRADGTDLIATTTMDFISISIGTTKKNEGTNRMTDGEAAIAKTTAIIDGQNRTWLKLLGRDV